jgi:peroxiredoxin
VINLLRRAAGAIRPAGTPVFAALGLMLVGSGPSLAQAPAPAAAPVSAYQRQMDLDQAAHPTLKIGAALPDFSLKGTDGKMHTPKDYKDAQVLVVAFISNHCPASQVYEGRIKKLAADYAARGVRLIAIQPDGPKAAALSELNYTDLDDSYDSMVIHAKYRKFDFPYLYDGDLQDAASKFGPKVTPHIFIFDKDRKLRFEGRIDDALLEAKAKTHEGRDAIDALLAGKAPAVDHTAVFGCSTKWNDKVEGAQRQAKAWLEKPVNVETISLDGLKALRQTAPGKFLMINFWATWCGPCQTEYPELLTTYQWYNNRNFDFVSVSVDAPDQKVAVQRFLDNLQVTSDDVFAIQKAFDAAWESGVPYTIVLAPDGKVIYRKEGENDILTLRRAILANLDDKGPFAGNADYWKQ